MIHSLVELTLDADGKVSHMVDKWDGQELNHKMGVRLAFRRPVSTGRRLLTTRALLALPLQGMKRVHAKVAKALVRVP